MNLEWCYKFEVKFYRVLCFSFFICYGSDINFEDRKIVFVVVEVNLEKLDCG